MSIKHKTARTALLLSLVLACSAAFSQSAPQADRTADPCAAIQDAAQAAKKDHTEEILKNRDSMKKVAKSVSSCLARAQDSVVRAAIPPSLGTLLGVLADPIGMVEKAAENASCNVITQEANKVSNEAYRVNSEVRGVSQRAQQAVTGAVNDAFGGKAGNIYTPPPPERGENKSLICRVFGRC